MVPRVSTQHQYRNLTERITFVQSQMAKAQRQLSTGKRVELPSDDPFAAAGIMLLRNVRSLANQHKGVADAVTERTRLAESAFDEMSDLMAQARTIAVKGATATTEQDARLVMAGQVRQLQERLLNAGNEQDGSGNYIFSGFKSKTLPFARDSVSIPPTVSYSGDTNIQIVEVGPNLTLPANFVVNGEVKAAYDALEDLVGRLTSGDASGISGVSLELIESASREVRRLLGEAGGRINEFAAAADTALRRSDEFTRQISDREDADMAKVVVDLQSAETAYQSALAAFSSMTGMSLLDFLRG